MRDWLAAVDLADPVAAVKELERCVKQLGFKVTCAVSLQLSFAFLASLQGLRFACPSCKLMFPNRTSRGSVAVEAASDHESLLPAVRQVRRTQRPILYSSRVSALVHLFLIVEFA